MLARRSATGALLMLVWRCRAEPRYFTRKPCAHSVVAKWCRGQIFDSARAHRTSNGESLHARAGSVWKSQGNTRAYTIDCPTTSACSSTIFADRRSRHFTWAGRQLHAVRHIGGLMRAAAMLSVYVIRYWFQEAAGSECTKVQLAA